MITFFTQKDSEEENIIFESSKFWKKFTQRLGKPASFIEKFNLGLSIFIWALIWKGVFISLKVKKRFTCVLAYRIKLTKWEQELFVFCFVPWSSSHLTSLKQLHMEKMCKCIKCKQIVSKPSVFRHKLDKIFDNSWIYFKQY